MSYSPDDLERVLRRITIPRGQVTLLKALHDADDYVPRSELVDYIRGGDARGFTGVLSAFAGRINGTRGFEEEKPGYRAFIERRKIDGVEHMRLRREAREAVERVPKLVEAMGEPMEVLLEGVSVHAEALSLAEQYARRNDTEVPRSWAPTSPEDRLLQAYWEEIGGTIITEVEIGGSGPSTWPAGSRRRRIDGVRFASSNRDEIYSPGAFTQSQMRDIFHRRHVEVIEVKAGLNRPVIGQAIAGRDMFRRDYAPATVEPVVLCGRGDPALEWVCRRNGVRVVIAEK